MKNTINEIKERLGVDQIWSWSKYKTFKSDTYTYYLKYIVTVLEDLPNNRYGKMGNISHDILENYYGGKVKYNNMAKIFEAGVFEVDLIGLKYDRTNADKNKAIALKYEESVKHFFKHHVRIANKVKTEIYLLTFIGKYLFQGYIDAIHKEDGCCVITDWKTSSIYTGDKLKDESGQLLIYAIALYNMGYKPSQIKVRWNFLKYTTVEVALKNGNTRVSNIVRSQLGNSLMANVKMWLKDAKYTEDEINEYLNVLRKNNSIAHLPESIQSKYVFNDCYTYVECTEEILEAFKLEVIKTLDEANEKELEYKKTRKESIWWQEVTDGYSYFMANLSGYSAKIHKPYATYLDELHTRNNELAEISKEFLSSEILKMLD